VRVQVPPSPFRLVAILTFMKKLIAKYKIFKT